MKSKIQEIKEVDTNRIESKITKILISIIIKETIPDRS